MKRTTSKPDKAKHGIRRLTQELKFRGITHLPLPNERRAWSSLYPKTLRKFLNLKKVLRGTEPNPILSMDWNGLLDGKNWFDEKYISRLNSDHEEHELIATFETTAEGLEGIETLINTPGLSLDEVIESRRFKRRAKKLKEAQGYRKKSRTVEEYAPF